MKNIFTKLLKRLPNNSKKKSIAFISMHKCATSYFSSVLLKKTDDYQLIDYLNLMYNNEKHITPEIQKYNHIYGVIRLQDSDHPRYQFVKNFLSHKNFKSIQQIYWIRDPRDILVSMYYSFGFTHALSDVSDFRKYQINQKELISKMTLDEYVLNEANNIKVKFSLIDKLLAENSDGVLFKYEDMILDFDSFFEKFNSFFTFSDETKLAFYQDTRPKESEDNKQHKRSGKTGGYKNKLKKDTILELNIILNTVLKRFDYEV